MHLTVSLIATAMFIMVSYISNHVQACATPSNALEGFQLGDDGPADLATLSYSLNHFSLLVNDLNASMHFYGKVLGMRHVFTFRPSDDFELVYLSHSQGGRNGTGFQTGEALYAQKTNTEGQLELIHHTSKNRYVATTQRVSTFSHIGLIVPDPAEVQDRMIKFGVRILKKVGQEFNNPEDELEGSRAFGFGNDIEMARTTIRQLNALGFDKFLIATDPDGNVLEIQPAAI